LVQWKCHLMSKEVTLTIKEQKHLRLVNRVESGTMTVVRAAESLGLSERHVYRLLARYRLEGRLRWPMAIAGGLQPAASGERLGRPPPENVARHASAATASVDPGRGCSCRWTAAITTGWAINVPAWC